MNRELLDKASVAFGKPELDLFSVPPTQVGVEDSFFTEVQPQAAVTTEGPWSFLLGGSQFMTDLSKNYIMVRLKITQVDGNNLPAPPAGQQHPMCGPINLLGKTLFEQLKLYLNGKMVYDTGDTYSYMAYLTTVLQYGKEAKKNQLLSAGYSKEPHDHIDLAELPHNMGWRSRSAPYAASALVDLMAPLDFPLAQQERYLPPNVEVKVSLTRHTDQYALLSAEQNPTYKIVVESIRWLVRQVQVTPALELTLHSAMQKSLAKYPVRRTQIRTLYIAAGLTRAPANNIWTGQIPRRIIVGMVTEHAFSGQYDRSPFNFQNFGLRKAWVVANGETYPKRGRPIEVQFNNNLYMAMYVQFYEALGLANTDKSLDISPEDLKAGHCLIAIDLKADTGVEDSSWETVRTGVTSVHLELANAVPAATGGVRVICMGEFDNLMTIDGNRNVFSDFAI